MSKRFRIVIRREGVRERIFKYLCGNRKGGEAVDKIIKFGNQHSIIISTSVEEYERREIKKSKIVLASLYRMCTLVTAVRFFLSSVFNNKTMITLMCDGHYLMSNPRILSVFVSLNCFVVLFIGLLLQMNEMQYKLYLLTFLHQWKHHQLIPLNEKNNRKLAIIINLMVILLMKQGFWPLVVFSSLLYIGSSIVAYFDHEYDFFIPSLVFFNLCVVVWILQHYCIVSAGFVAWSVPLFYLKFKFREIHENIQICLKKNNLNALKNLISQHNRLVIQTKLGALRFTKTRFTKVAFHKNSFHKSCVSQKLRFTKTRFTKVAFHKNSFHKVAFHKNSFHKNSFHKNSFHKKLI